MIELSNLYEDQGSYCRLFFIIAQVGNLDTYLRVTLVYFFSDKGG